MFHFRFKLIVINDVLVMHWKYLLNMFWPHYLFARILHILTLEQFLINIANFNSPLFGFMEMYCNCKCFANYSCLQISVLHYLVSWKCIAIANVLQIILACKFHMR